MMICRGSKKEQNSYTLFLTSCSVLFTEMRSLASRLKRLIWKSCCILRRSFDGITTGLPETTRQKWLNSRLKLSLLAFLTSFALARNRVVIVRVEEIAAQIDARAGHVMAHDLRNSSTSSPRIPAAILYLYYLVEREFGQVKNDTATYQRNCHEHEVKLFEAAFQEIPHFWLNFYTLIHQLRFQLTCFCSKNKFCDDVSRL
jgi:hypothetical protein